MLFKNKIHGFTLIELSIVLVIIGLIVGGIVAGKHMVYAADLRALLSQKDKFTVAVNIFKNKYGALPGDISPASAAKVGLFTFTGSWAGKQTLYLDNGYGDGNGKIAPGQMLEYGCFAECGAFWRHLSDAGLIPTTGTTLNPDTNLGAGAPLGETGYTSKQSLYMPKAKFGIAYWGVASLRNSALSDSTGSVVNINVEQNSFFLGLGDSWDYAQNMSAIDAYILDLKIDDGKPNSGKFLVSTYDSDAPDWFYWSNGTVDYFLNALGTASTVCTIGGTNPKDITAMYNVDPAKGGNTLSCVPIFVW